MELPRDVKPKAQNHRKSRGWGTIWKKQEWVLGGGVRKSLGVGDNLEKTRIGTGGRGGEKMVIF